LNPYLEATFMTQNQLVNGHSNALCMGFGGRIFLGIRPESNDFWSQRGPENPAAEQRSQAFQAAFEKVGRRVRL
jgi:hypothetical protein